MQFFLLRAGIALIASGIAAYTDFKTGLIPDKLTYALIITGALLALAESNFLIIYLGAVILFLAGYLIYFKGKIGGGDVKLFVGLHLVLPFIGNNQLFLIVALFYAALLSSFFIPIQHFFAYLKKGIDFEENRENFGKGMLLITAILVLGGAMLASGKFNPIGTLIIVIPMLSAAGYSFIENGIKKHFFCEEIDLNELDEDELIAAEFIEKELLEKLQMQGKGIIGEKEKLYLKEQGITKIKVYRNLPKFGPFIFLGVLAAILYPDILSLLLL